MNKFNFKLLLGLMAFALVFGFLCAGAWNAYSQKVPTIGKAEVAYWVQAFLALFTLVTAVYVLRAQSAHSVKLMIASDERNLRRRVDSVGAILTEAYRQLEAVRVEIHGDEYKELASKQGIPVDQMKDRMYAVIALNRYRGKPQFAEILRVIDAVPMHDIGSKDMVQAVFEVREALIRMEAELASAWAEGEDKFNDITLWNGASTWPALARGARERFDNAAAALFQSDFGSVHE